MNEGHPTALGKTSVYDQWSEAVGDIFRIFTAECGADPQAILFVTDANGLFGLTVDTVRLMQLPGIVPSLLVVGVGYPHAQTLIDTIGIRTRDLTPTSAPSFPSSGGADRFIRFIQSELWPSLRSKYPTATDRIYFGHSLGGLFGAYTMLSHTNVFDRFIIGSPSLWWDDHKIFTFDPSQNYSCDQVDTEAVVGIGSLETDEGRRLEAANLPDTHPAKPPKAHLDMVDDARTFVARFDHSQGLDLHYVEIADEFHATVPPVVLNRALRQFFRSP